MKQWGYSIPNFSLWNQVTKGISWKTTQLHNLWNCCCLARFKHSSNMSVSRQLRCKSQITWNYPISFLEKAELNRWETWKSKTFNLYSKITWFCLSWFLAKLSLNPYRDNKHFCMKSTPPPHHSTSSLTGLLNTYLTFSLLLNLIIYGQWEHSRVVDVMKETAPLKWIRAGHIARSWTKTVMD